MVDDPEGDGEEAQLFELVTHNSDPFTSNPLVSLSSRDCTSEASARSLEALGSDVSPDELRSITFSLGC